MQSLILIFLGGGMGSLLRYGIGQYFTSYNSTFPVGTFLSNILASLVLGFLIGIQIKNNLNTNMALLFMTGFCGGFSTFSTFSAETLKLFQNNQIATALIYVGGSIICGLIAVYIGIKLQSTL